MGRGYTTATIQSQDGLTLHYRDYGDPQADRLPVICLTGLTRNAADFGALARHLAPHRRVISPDFRGRGRSDPDPNYRNYHPETYAHDVLHLLDHLGIEKIISIGTSLGGLVTMIWAAQAPTKLAGVVLNDVGPELDPVGIARVAAYAGQMPETRTWRMQRQRHAQRMRLPFLIIQMRTG